MAKVEANDERWRTTSGTRHNHGMSTQHPAPNSDTKKIEVNRPLVGVIALGCLVIAGVLWQMPDSNDMWVAGFMRAGLMTGAIWLALPTKNRPAAWANVSPRTLIGVVGDPAPNASLVSLISPNHLPVQRAPRPRYLTGP